MLSLIETEIAIKYVKDTFENVLSKNLDLVRVSAPIMVKPESGLNDNLSGVERTVAFTASDMNVEIVQSLAKWKRNALAKYNFPCEKGLYTDMNAIRRDEKLDNIHSVYVDQWDWERIITKNERNLEYLFNVVSKIYASMLDVANKMEEKYDFKYNLPKEIKFISTLELESKYPNISRKERENKITKEYGAVFLYGIGWPLKDGQSHDSRAADYDDWNYNGDILLWFSPLEIALELSSMGIRVDEESLVKQIKFKKEEFKLENPYCKDVLAKKLPYTIGGGIGQSRLCMFYLQKKHIGEVQASIWPEEMILNLKKEGIDLL